MKIIWTPGSNLAFPDILSRNVTIDEYQHHQLQQKKLPRDIQFFDEHGQQMTYKIGHDDTSAETCNDFYPIHCQQGKDQKILRLHNDGENFSLNSISTDFATSSVILAADCFRMGRTINQFRRFCRSGSPASLSSSESSTGTHSSISVIETDGIEEPGSSSYAERVVPEGCDSDEEEDEYVCEINANDHYRLCKARAALDLVISDLDTLLAKKTLSAAAAPHLRTPDLITKLDDVANIVDLDVPTILQEQLKDPVLSIVSSWIERNLCFQFRPPEIRQSKGLLRYGQELDRLLIEEHGQLLCYDELSDPLDEMNLRICLPLSLFLVCFRMGHYNELGGHMGASKTYANAKMIFFWPGMFDRICALTNDCLTCQNNKPKPKQLNELPLEEWQGDTAPICAIHFDHKGPLHPPSSRNTHCLLIVDSFSRFLMVYPVSNTGARATIAAVEKWILQFGIPQSIIHDRGTAFLNTDFVNWTKELGIFLRPRTAHSPWTNGKVETQNQHIAHYWRSFLNDAGTNCASLASKFAFAHNTSVYYTTGKTPY